MVRLEATFNAAEGITPDLAAQLVQHASRFESRTEIELGSSRVVLGSLIGLLSLKVKPGCRLTIIVNGKDEEEAANDICRLIEA